MELVAPPAVAVMAKVPGAAPVKSRLHPALTADRATELYRCFLLDRLDALVSVVGIAPVVAFTPPEAVDAIAAVVPAGFRCVAQQGDDLGARLDTLLATLIADGHRGAIAIDSDSPTLPMAFVAEAARVLEDAEADVVVGPCDDGGYYLIGVRAPRPALFADMPWSTPDVLPLTLARAQGLATHVLPAWFDVDTEPDLRRLHDEMQTGGGPRRTLAFVRALYR
ncbi:MAG: TIGR04282 family arsenosugar biosynthesis glycosyltransferase [Candidatus Rokubacteria bacterium]|nr:TIGR04282 family arsenosugar biosynthesis glycosyltransferase [Candidatus Rokubacteria bacterium]